MVQDSKEKGKLIIISGPSGVGKSTISAELVKRTGAFLSVSSTTRPKGDGEVDGKDYFFLSEQQFQDMVEKGEFLEYAEVFGDMYGTGAKQVRQALSEAETVLLEIDVQGAVIVKKQYADAVMIFILPPSQGDLAQRMAGRARGEDVDMIKKRLDSAGVEVASAWQHYDHMVINADLNQAVEEITQIIEGKTDEDK